jgi:hypothetical protein
MVKAEWYLVSFLVERLDHIGNIFVFHDLLVHINTFEDEFPDRIFVALLVQGGKLGNV